MDEKIFGSHPIAPNKIERPTNVDLKRVLLRIQVLLRER